MKIIFVNDESSIWKEEYEEKYKSIEGVEEIIQVKPEEISEKLNDEDPEKSECGGIGFFNRGRLFFRRVGEKVLNEYKKDNGKFKELKPEDFEAPEEKKEEKFKFVRTFILKKGSKQIGLELISAPTTMKQYFKIVGSNENAGNRMMLFERESSKGQIVKSMIGFIDAKGETTYTEINPNFYYAIMTEENFSDSWLIQYKCVVKKDEENERWILFKFDDVTIVKVFFNTEEDKNAFEMPEDFLVDITDDDRFKPHNLAMNPYKNWKDDFYKEKEITDDEMHYSEEEQQEMGKEMLGGMGGLGALFGALGGGMPSGEGGLPFMNQMPPGLEIDENGNIKISDGEIITPMDTDGDVEENNSEDPENGDVG